MTNEEWKQTLPECPTHILVKEIVGRLQESNAWESLSFDEQNTLTIEVVKSLIEYRGHND